MANKTVYIPMDTNQFDRLSRAASVAGVRPSTLAAWLIRQELLRDCAGSLPLRLGTLDRQARARSREVAV